MEAGGDLRTQPEGARRLVDDDGTAGTTHRSIQAHPVDGREGSEIDDLHRCALLCGDGGGVQAGAHHRPPRDEGSVGSLPQDSGLVHGNGPLFGVHLPLDVVAAFGFEEDHGIRRCDGLLDHPVGVVRVGRGDHLQPRGVTEVRLGGFGVVLDGPNATAVGDAHHHRHRLAPGGAGVQFRDLRDELIEGGEDKTVELDLGDHTVAAHRQSHGGADDSRFRQRRVDDPVGSELRLEALRDAEHTTEFPDVLAGDQDLRISLEGTTQAQVDGLGDRHGAHACSPTAHSAYSRRCASRATVFSA